MKSIMSVVLGLVLTGCTSKSTQGEAPMPQQQLLKPFLAIPLAKTTTPLEISQGWVYSEDEKSIHPDIPTHFAVDFPGKWRTPIYAPADGVGLASYHTYDMTDSKGRTIGYGLGLFVQLWHEESQLYTLYAHLSALNNTLLPYIAPTLEDGSWQPRKALYVNIEEFKRNAKPVKKGETIGYMGYTGLRLNYNELPSNPPAINPNKHKTWDPHGPHLHWEVYTRTPDGSKKDKRYDPFDIYAEREAYGDVFKKASGLILANPDGSPQFAK